LYLLNHRGEFSLKIVLNKSNGLPAKNQSRNQHSRKRTSSELRERVFAPIPASPRHQRQAKKSDQCWSAKYKDQSHCKAADARHVETDFPKIGNRQHGYAQTHIGQGHHKQEWRAMEEIQNGQRQQIAAQAHQDEAGTFRAPGHFKVTDPAQPFAQDQVCQWDTGDDH